jgi:DNA polymerase-3 subunit gamma/tau
MGYQVTARKWRPQTFDDVVEQQHVTRTLRNAIRLQRVAHAYLFAGTRGVGKTTMARVLAKALNCEQGPTEHPCNMCHACQEITQGSSLDIIEIDGASNRGIDEIRDLREQLRYLPSHGRYKVYIIDEVHMLTKEAFNALLKTLEEPPPHVVFIFATTELEKIPYTIVSRCQRFEFKRVSLDGIVERLASITQQDGITISHTSLIHLAKAAEGSMRDAQSLLDQAVAYSGLEVHDTDVAQILGHVGTDTLIACLTALFQQDAAAALHTIHLLQAEGHEAIGIMRTLQEGLRHLIVLKTVPQPESLIPLAATDLAALRLVTETTSIEEIYGQFHILSGAETTLRHATNPFLVLEMTLVRMACIGRVPSLQSILEHLQQLEAGQLPSVPPEVPPLAPAALAQLPRPLAPAASAPSPSLAVPDASPAGSALTAGNDFWQALQTRVERRRPALAAFLQPGRILSHDERKLIIGFPKQESFCRVNVLESDNLQLIREVAQELTGHPLQVVVESLTEALHQGQDASEVAGAGQQTTVEHIRQHKSEFKQELIDIFRATPI